MSCIKCKDALDDFPAFSLDEIVSSEIGSDDFDTCSNCGGIKP